MEAEKTDGEQKDKIEFSVNDELPKERICRPAGEHKLIFQCEKIEITDGKVTIQWENDFIKMIQDYMKDTCPNLHSTVKIEEIVFDLPDRRFIFKEEIKKEKEKSQ